MFDKQQLSKQLLSESTFRPRTGNAFDIEISHGDGVSLIGSHFQQSGFLVSLESKALLAVIFPHDGYDLFYGNVGELAQLGEAAEIGREGTMEGRMEGRIEWKVIKEDRNEGRREARIEGGKEGRKDCGREGRNKGRIDKVRKERMEEGMNGGRKAEMKEGRNEG